MRLLVILFGFLLVPCFTWGSIADGEGKIQVVACHSDGSCVAKTFPLADEDVAKAESFWVWSDQYPPLRMQRAEYLDASSSLQEILGKQSVVRLRVYVGSPSMQGDGFADALVISAPVEMWDRVPENLLPAFSVRRNGELSLPRTAARTRIRVIGEGHGGLWRDLEGSVSEVNLALSPSHDANLLLESSAGKPVKAFLSVMQAERGKPSSQLRAQYATDERSSISLPSIPRDEPVTILLTSKGHAPLTITGTASDLSGTVRLQPAAEIRGRFVDPAGNPVSGASVIAEAWISTEGSAIARSETRSDESGSWKLTELPRRDTSMRVSAKGFVTLNRKVSLVDGDADVGEIAMEKAGTLNLLVLDESDIPMEGVRVSTDAGPEGITHKDGRVDIPGISASAVLQLTLECDTCIRTKVRVAPPFEKAKAVTVTRAVTLRGTVVDEEFTPVRDATIRIETGNSIRTELVGAEGQFTVSVTPEQESQLTFESPQTSLSKFSIEPGRAGETRELGPIRLLRGKSVKGRLVAATSGEPVTGARVWVLRPSPDGAISSWIAKRVIEASSNSDGSFEHRGLPPGPALLRIDAPGFARAHRSVSFDDSSQNEDVGTVTLMRGSTVKVYVSEPDDPAIARVDLRGEWLEIDMIAAPIRDGSAIIRNVPLGAAIVTVTHDYAVVCEKSIDVSETGSEVEVECGSPIRVSGRVFFGTSPAQGGTLSWSSTRNIRLPSLIMNEASPLGAARQHAYGLGAGVVTARVDEYGQFSTSSLRPGEWRVAWSSVDGAAESQVVQIPDLREAHVTIRYSNVQIRGRVIDEHGESVSGAHVREIGGPNVAISQPDGSFTMIGVSPGLRRMQATLGKMSSEIAEIDVKLDRETPPIHLTVKQDDSRTLFVSVIGEHGEPGANAFVFIDTGETFSRIVTANSSGLAEATFPGGVPTRIRMAVYFRGMWAFSDFQDTRNRKGKPLLVRVGPTAGLLIESKTSTAVASVTTSSGWHLTGLFARLGSELFVSPGNPLTISGLPAGAYDVKIDNASQNVSVTTGKNNIVSFP